MKLYRNKTSVLSDVKYGAIMGTMLKKIRDEKSVSKGGSRYDNGGRDTEA